jgi:Tfp pilus assembly protein PilF
MLYRKSFYVIALNLAKTQQLDESSVADIHKQYGDHLYSKGDYDGAMQQFVQTMRHLQPSYVIRKVYTPTTYHAFLTRRTSIYSSSSMLKGSTTL